MQTDLSRLIGQMDGQEKRRLFEEIADQQLYYLTPPAPAGSYDYIPAIRMMRILFKLGLREAKLLIDLLIVICFHPRISIRNSVMDAVEGVVIEANKRKNPTDA